MSRLWICVAVVASTVPVALLVNYIAPHSYMDEIFHVSQTQQYCEGNFDRWDPMITTPPALYFLAYAYTKVLLPGMQIIGRMSNFPNLCSPPILRSLNIILAIVCAILFRDISLHLEPEIGTKVASLKALALAWYPLHWFFSFLFYTDVGSTTVVMAMYLACLKELYWISGMFGLLAILFRQTNVVWTFFVACVGIMDFLRKESYGAAVPLRELYQKVPVPCRRQPIVGSQLTNECQVEPDICNKQKVSMYEEGLVKEILVLLYWAWHKRRDLILHFLPLILPIIGFLVFVLYNGSIVLGAKEAHQVSPHFTQVLYFGAVSAVAMAPVHLNLHLMKENLRRVLAIKTGTLGYFLAGLVGAGACVHYFSLAHPYLLSDNRHYTFYIWRRIINAWWSAKYLLTFIYFYSWCSILATIGKRQKKLWLFVYFLAVVAVLVPAPLIEFRYYTVPFYFIALHTPTTRKKGSHVWLLISLQYLVINCLTMYIFLFRPFYNGEHEAQRFIW